MVGTPLERVAINIMGPLSKSKREICTYHLQEIISQWVDAVQIRNQKASTVAKKLIDRIISIFGAPVQIKMTRGDRLNLIFFKKCVKTTPNRPQSDGLGIDRT